jgi:hypothetical protein
MKMFVDPSEVHLHRDFVDFRNYAEHLIMCCEQVGIAFLLFKIN